MDMIKILINTPDIKHIGGGVTNFYKSLKPYWTEDVRYNYIGKRIDICSKIGVLWLPFDIVKYSVIIWKWRPDAVLLNPTFDRSGMIRDLIFLRVALMFKCRVSIMFHGCDESYAKRVNKDRMRKLLNRTQCILSLSRNFTAMLRSWGITVPVLPMTTRVDDSLIADFDVETRKGDVRTFLFVSRIVKGKGIYETIETFAKIKASHPDIRLKIVGDGSELPKIRKYIAQRHIPDIDLTGQIEGHDLAEAFKTSDFFIFPTFHYEGLPNAVLEAMAFGLPVLTRLMGGIPDFFEDGKMGILTDSDNPDEYCRLIEGMMDDRDKIRRISIYNHEYAKTHFMASKVVEKMEGYIRMSTTI